MRKKPVFLVLIFLIYFVISFYKLDEIPGEWFGDISNVHEYTSQILKGEWPFYFFQSPGPVYHYAIAPLVILTGDLGYLTYKISSVVIGLIGLVGIYLLAKELMSRKIALLTVGITSVSFWFLVFTRLGNSQIIIPILTVLAVYFAYRRNLLWGVVVSSLGLFTYPQTFILPLLFIILIFVRERKKLLIALVSFLPAVLLFTWVVSKQPENFTGGYVGEKIFKVKGNFADYLINTVSMLYLEGDKTFRVNVPGSPHLDVISGLFFILGLIYFLKYKRKELPFILLPLFILIIPSVSPAIPAVEIPSMSRSIGVIPFVYLLIASGIFESFRLLPKYILFPILVILVYLNLQKYFVDYPKGLPDGNVPYGRIVARYIDTLPENVRIRLTDCCWGEAGQPEPKAIYYVLKNKKERENIVHETFIGRCEEVDKNSPSLIIFNPYDLVLTEKFKSCFPKGLFRLHEEEGRKIFASLYITSF